MPQSVEDEGYNTPYAKYLEEELDHFCRIIGQLVIAHGEKKPIEPMLDELEKLMGDDWHVDLSYDDQKRLGAIKGWYFENDP